MLGLLLVALVWLFGFAVEFAAVSVLELGAAELDPAADAVVLSDELLVLLAFVGLLLPWSDDLPPALAFTVSCSLTCLTPVRDFASSRARFLSAFEATVPVSIAVPFETETCTFENAGS